MVKKLLIGCLLFLLMALPVFAADVDLITDATGTLSDDQYWELNDYAQAVTDAYGCEISVVMIDDKGSGSVDEVARQIYRDYNFGFGEDKSGLMLFISLAERDYSLIASGYGNTAFTDYGKEVLLDRYVLPELKNDNYYEGFKAYLTGAEEQLKMAASGAVFAKSNDPIVQQENETTISWLKRLAMLIPAGIAALFTRANSAKMVSAGLQSDANAYVLGDEFELSHQSDHFLRESISRRRIEKNTNTTVSSDGLSSKSGKF